MADSNNSHNDGGRSGREQPEFADRRPARAAAAAGLSAARKAGSPEPRAHSRARRARQGLGRLRHADHHRRHLGIHQGEGAAAGQEDRCFLRFSTVAGELGAADAERDVRGFALQVLHRGRQLGSGRQQHAGVLHPRPAEVPRLHPHPEAASAHQPALADRDVGLLVAVARKPAPGHDPDVRPRPADSAIATSNGYGSHTYSLHQRGRASASG